MAIVQNPLIGKTRNSVGNTTFSSWKGINVMKSKAVSVANPKSPAQMAQRDKLGFVVAFYRLVSSLINVGFISQAIKQSAYNAFASVNLKNGAFLGTTANVVDDFSALQVAKGTLATTDVSSVVKDNVAKDVTINWATDLVGGQAATDLAFAMVLNSAGDILGTDEGLGTRNAGTLTIQMDATANLAGAIHVYLFFYNAASRNSSDSVYKLA